MAAAHEWYVSISWYEGLSVEEGIWKEGMKREKEERSSVTMPENK